MKQQVQKQVSNSKGIGILEAVIAVALVIVLVYLVSNFVTMPTKSGKNLRSLAECQNFIDTLATDLKTKDNKVVVRNNFIVASRPNEVQVAYSNPLFNGTPNSPVFQNIDGLATRLYRNVPRAACTTPGGIPVRSDNAVNPSIRASDVFSSDNLIQDGSGNTYNVFFSMIGVDLDTGISNCTNIDNFQGLSRDNVAGARNIAIEFTVTAQYNDENGNTLSCQTSNRTSYDRDANPPTLSTQQNSNAGNAVFGNTLNGGSAAHQPIPNGQPQPFLPNFTNTVCNPSGAANGGVWMQLTSTEAGSIFICKEGNDPTWPSGGWKNCAGFDFSAASGIYGALDPASPEEGAPFSTNLRFVGLPEGQYQLTVASMDTSGNLSNTLFFRFTVDLVRPTWAGPLSRSNNVVGRSDEFPVGSPDNPAFTLTHAQRFGAQLYQCSLNSEPQFQGDLSPIVLLNERCTGRTYGLGLNDNIAGTGGVDVLTNTCQFAITPTPSFQSGEIEFRAELRDICQSDGEAVDAAAVASVNWVIDSPSDAQIQAVHSPVSFNGPVAQPYLRNSLPTFRADFARTPSVLNNYPIVWMTPPTQLKTQNLSGGGTTSSGNATSFTPAELNLLASEPGSCNYGGGFCAVAFSPCGQLQTSVNEGRSDNSLYAIRGQVGHSCNRVPCEVGLQCSYMDESAGVCASRTSFSCTTSNQWKCTNHSDCTGSGNECFTEDGNPLSWENTIFNLGNCLANTTRLCNEDGDCVTREGLIGTCDASGVCICPDEASSGLNAHNTCTYNYSEPGGFCFQSPPNCSCDSGVAGTMCPADSFANSCGVEKACRGTNTNACPNSGYTPFLDINCRLDEDDINIWLGARTDQNIFQASGVAEWATGGFGPGQYTYTCSTTSAIGPWGSCVYGTWAESPNFSASPWLSYWVRVEDSRGDYEICGGQYKLDRTPPTFSVAPSIPACGREAAPTLATQIQSSFTITDSHSDTIVTSRNRTYSQVGTSCTKCVNNETSCAANCNNVNVPVTNDRNNNSSQEVELTATDQAGNTTVRTTLAYAAANSGITLSVSPGTPYTNTGCATCSSAPYNQGLTGTLSGTNSHNFHSTMTILRSPGNPLSYSPASWPGGVNTDIKFNSEAISSMTLSFRDSCGNLSANATANFVLDWTSPSLSGNCNFATQSVNFSGVDSRSGMQSINITCTPSGSSGTGVSSVSVGPLAKGVSHTCESNGGDNASNTTNTADGYGLVRTQSVTCYFPRDCNLPATLGGGVLPHSQTVTAFLESQTLDDACSSIIRTCDDGTLLPAGSPYVHSSCNGRCTNPLGGILNDGQSVTPVYQSLTVPFSSTCQSETRTCNNGSLSGSYVHATCNRDCQSPWGSPVAHGASIQGYSAATVPSGQTCASRLGTMTCSNGTLSNSSTYTHQFCRHDCNFSGTNVAHNSSVNAYSANSVSCGQSCAPLMASRTCNDGTLGGPFTHTFTNCAPTACANCTSPNGNHGQTITGYRGPPPAFASGCNLVSATCTNGNWIGSIPERSTCNHICTQAGTWRCTKLGDVIRAMCLPPNPHRLCGHEDPICVAPGNIPISDECCSPQGPASMCGKCGNPLPNC